MNYGDHNFIQITQQTSCELRSSCRASRAVLFDKLDTAKMHGLDTSYTCRVVSRRNDPSGNWALFDLQQHDSPDAAVVRQRAEHVRDDDPRTSAYRSGPCSRRVSI